MSVVLNLLFYTSGWSVGTRDVHRATTEGAPVLAPTPHSSLPQGTRTFSGNQHTIVIMSLQSYTHKLVNIYFIKLQYAEVVVSGLLCTFSLVLKDAMAVLYT